MKRVDPFTALGIAVVAVVVIFIGVVFYLLYKVL